MSINFYPTGFEGLSLDAEVRTSFVESVQWCHDSLEKKLTHERPVIDLNQLENSNAPQIGFYYSLSTLLAELQSDELISKSEELSFYLKGSLGLFKFTDKSMMTTCHDLFISNFNSDYFTEQEIACLSKWLDTEPENSLSMTSVTNLEFELALKDLEKAFNFIEIYALPFYEEFRATTKEVILAKPSGMQKLVFGGVSSFALWGSMCLNAQEHLDWKDYFRSVIHEYSHNILFAKAMRSPLVENPSDQVFFSPLRGSYRPMDGIYHAAFVSARETLAAEMALNHPKIHSWNEIHPETILFLKNIRYSSKTNFEECFLVLQSQGHLTELGRLILSKVCEAMVDIKLD